MIPNSYEIDDSAACRIEDAILLGHVEELDAVLEDLADDEDFPRELFYGLEALRHFRAHYSGNPLLNKLQKQRVALMDSAWGAELLETIKSAVQAPAAKRVWDGQ